MPWNNQALALLVLVEKTGGWSGVFGYSPDEGPGNLVFSVSAAAGTDPYGNAYPAGVSTTAGSGTIEGPDYLIDSAGAFWYSGTPGSGNLILSIAGAAGTDPHGNIYPEGISFAKGSVPGGLIDPGTVGTTQIDFTARDIGGITTSIAATAPTGAQDGDLWFDTSSGYQLNQYEAGAWTPYQYGTSAIAAGSVTAALIAANTITASQIAAGTITAAQIAAGTITAGQLADTGLNPNPAFSGGSTAAWAGYGGTLTAVQPTSPPPPTPYVGQLVANGTTVSPSIEGSGSGLFAVVPGDVWGVTAQVSLSVVGTVIVGFDWHDSSGAYLSTNTTQVSVPAAVWQRVFATQTAPASAAYAIVRVGIAGTPAAGTTLQATNAYVIAPVNGGIIEAGTITASQIAAGTVVAGIVDGTTIEGATLIAGTTGSPQVKITSSGGVGEIQFPLPSTLYNPALFNADIPTNFAQLLLAGPTLISHPDWISHEINSSDGTSTANEVIFYNTATTPSAPYEMAHVDNTGFNIDAGSVTGAAPGANPAVPDAWRGLGVPSGWTGHLTAGGTTQGGRYYKMAEAQAVWIDIFLSAPSGGATSATFPYSIASGWLPSVSRFWPAALNGSTAANARIYVNAGNGEVQILGLPAGYSGEVSASFMLSLD
ncbi:MAG: hypothetical protein ACYCO9_16395 [Streptosporangiaceae bacterium]